MRRLAVINQKGGVGKTTTVTNLGAALALGGKRVLLIDMDPQANASSAYGIVNAERQIYDALIDEAPLTHCAFETELETLHVVPAGRDLVGAEIELVGKESREFQLDRAIRAVGDAYEIILIDCPPSLGLLTLNALTAADAVLIPLQCEYYALEGLAALMNTVQQIQETVNPNLEIEGILRTMYDPRNSLTLDVSGQLSEYFGDKVYRAVIPRNVRLAEAPSYGMPALKYDRVSKGAVAYLALAGEMVRRHGSKKTSPAVAV